MLYVWMHQLVQFNASEFWSYVAKCANWSVSTIQDRFDAVYVPQIAGFCDSLRFSVEHGLEQSLYEAADALFSANLMGLEFINYPTVIVCLTLRMIASLVAPGIPSAGMVNHDHGATSVGLQQRQLRFLPAN
ncbi:hypothetical protein FQA39_LY19415 [Lamprigera yunnana]|nr:hypothetical protein FQA39_LY19415 [Lamprigera yunnana]